MSTAIHWSKNWKTLENKIDILNRLVQEISGIVMGRGGDCLQKVWSWHSNFTTWCQGSCWYDRELVYCLPPPTSHCIATSLCPWEIFPSIYLSSCLCIHLASHPSIHSSTYLFTHPSVCPSACPSIHLFTLPSIHPSIHSLFFVFISFLNCSFIHLS